MLTRDLKVGDWVKLRDGGFGTVESTDKYHPPAIKIKVVGPVPFGIRFYKPRDVIEKLEGDPRS